MASFTVRIFSASSSGISMSKASSKAMTSSTVSSESAPRSSTKEALGVTSPSSTPSCSTMICFTFSSTAAMLLLAQMDWGLLGQREILTAGGSCGQTAGQTQSCRTGPRARDIVWLSKLRIDGARGFYLSTIDRNPWLQPRMLVSDQSPKLSFSGGDWFFGERGIVSPGHLGFVISNARSYGPQLSLDAVGFGDVLRVHEPLVQCSPPELKFPDDVLGGIHGW